MPPPHAIILIGMPGAGKSTVGPLLAEALDRTFTDTDLLIRARAGRRLQEILDTDGPAAFLAAEEQAILAHRFDGAVVATGGSVVFSERAMAHLKAAGTVVYLKIPFGEMKRRLRDAAARGIMILPGQTLRGMYDERVPRYERYADLTIDCAGRDFATVAGMVIAALRSRETPAHTHRTR